MVCPGLSPVFGALCLSAAENCRCIGVHRRSSAANLVLIVEVVFYVPSCGKSSYLSSANISSPKRLRASSCSGLTARANGARLRRQLDDFAARVLDRLARDVLFLDGKLALHEDRFARRFLHPVLQRRRPALELARGCSRCRARDSSGRSACDSGAPCARRSRRCSRADFPARRRCPTRSLPAPASDRAKTAPRRAAPKLWLCILPGISRMRMPAGPPACAPGAACSRRGGSRSRNSRARGSRGCAPRSCA